MKYEGKKKYKILNKGNEYQDKIYTFMIDYILAKLETSHKSVL